MPARFEYPTKAWSHVRMRTRSDVEVEAQRRPQPGGVRGWAEDEEKPATGEQTNDQ
jgi:hypothetical protein